MDLTGTHSPVGWRCSTPAPAHYGCSWAAQPGVRKPHSPQAQQEPCVGPAGSHWLLPSDTGLQLCVVELHQDHVRNQTEFPSWQDGAGVLIQPLRCSQEPS